MKLVRRDPVEKDEEVFTIQQILNHQLNEETGEMEYLVRWKGFSPDHDSWIPFTNFIETTMIEQYRKRRGIVSNERSGPQPNRRTSKARTAVVGAGKGASSTQKQRSTRTTIQVPYAPPEEATRRSRRKLTRASNK
ncbi:hypothetical protein B0O80DRAFT_456683 [Mortierella sp. GBAus27b]|nr:hypothetical protein B0O80DRAFT_458413 [Mortierella sp. GBAus27b]KAI8350963.1 hypothetical protein B0O80DRAFT_456683 [Mortierella sp. GBAus27b]